MVFLEITVDNLINNQNLQNNKSGWREPSKKLTETILETHKIHLENLCNICKDSIHCYPFLINNVDKAIIIYENDDYLKDEYKVFENIIQKEIYKIYESRVKTSIYMNLSISSKLPKLLCVKLFI
jgi:hypothetical protein